jgi:hypothetical protein
MRCKINGLRIANLLYQTNEKQFLTFMSKLKGFALLQIVSVLFIFTGQVAIDRARIDFEILSGFGSIAAV